MVTKSKKKAVEFEYDTKQEDAALESVISPYYEELVMVFGIQTLRELGLQEDFIMTDELRKLIDQRIKGVSKEINATTKRKLQEAIEQSVSQQESLKETEGRVEDVYKDARDNRSNITGRTEVWTAIMMGVYAAYRQSGVVTSVTWWTQLDERVCPFCGPLHGTTQPLGISYVDAGETLQGELTDEQRVNLSKAEPKLEVNKAVEHPPLHPRCRCTLIPEVSPIKSYIAEITKRNEKVLEKSFDEKKTELQKELEKEKEKVAKKEKELKDQQKEVKNLIKKLENG